MEELDFEDIPFVFDDSALTEPSDEEVAVIAAALAALFPYEADRRWTLMTRQDAVNLRSGA